MKEKHVVREYNHITKMFNRQEFTKAVIEQMKGLGLIRFDGSTVVGDVRVFNYCAAPRSRAVRGKSW